MIALDDNEKLSINNVLEVIIGVGTLHPRVFLLLSNHCLSVLQLRYQYQSNNLATAFPCRVTIQQ